MNESDLTVEMIHTFVTQYYQQVHLLKPFTPGVNPVPVSGKVFNQDEMNSLVDSALEFWLTEGGKAKEFGDKLKKVCGRRYVALCNSGSSANLLAVSAIAKAGEKVLTTAVGFPTTLNPILQTGMEPIFLDVELGTYVPKIEDVQEALEKYHPHAIVLAHTLGNIAPLIATKEAYTIYDCCDALTSGYNELPITAYGDLVTLSFYPAHHITTGEGGAVLTTNPKLFRKIESLRDWGRDCWCPTGHDNTCNKRFDQQHGDLPAGYDHKYVYSEIGYNLKMTDLQAAVGIPQLDKMFDFAEMRERNFNFYDLIFQRYEEHFILPCPSSVMAEPSWFGFPLTIRPGSPIDRTHLMRFLDEKKIGTRLMFGGNLLRQPAYLHLNPDGKWHLPNSDIVMEKSFWIGVYPGITKEMREYVADCFDEYMKGI